MLTEISFSQAVRNYCFIVQKPSLFTITCNDKLYMVYMVQMHIDTESVYGDIFTILCLVIITRSCSVY